jgi:hypothetical protein
MKIPRRQFLHLAAGAAAISAVSRIAKAQTYPTRPLRWIVAFPPGGAADTLLATGVSTTMLCDEPKPVRTPPFDEAGTIGMFNFAIPRSSGLHHYRRRVPGNSRGTPTRSWKDPLASATTSASAVMKVFIPGFRRRLTFTVAALAEIQCEAIHTPSNVEADDGCLERAAAC